MNLNLPTGEPMGGPSAPHTYLPQEGPLCVKCQRPALYVVVRDGTLLREECAPGVKARLDDWRNKEVRPNDQALPQGGTKETHE